MANQIDHLPSVNEEIIKGNEMLIKAFHTLQERQKKVYFNWAAVVLDLCDCNEIAAHTKAFQEASDKSNIEQLEIINNARDYSCAKIEKKLTRLEEICKSLQIPMPSCGENYLPLHREYELLKKEIQDYEQLYNDRIAETNSLSEIEVTICQSLGLEPVKILEDSPLPSADELEQFKEYLKNLEDERSKDRQDLKKLQTLHEKMKVELEETKKSLQVPNPRAPNIKRNLSKEDCRVCGDVATGVNYSVATCGGCRIFFGKYSKSAGVYSCSRSGECPITKESRNRCRPCRFAKCIAEGMQKASSRGCSRSPSPSPALHIFPTAPGEYDHDSTGVCCY